MEEARLSKRRGVDPRYYLTNEGTGQANLWKCKKSAPSAPDGTTAVVFAKNTTGYLKVIPGTENTTMLTSLPTTFDQKGWLVDGPLNGTFAGGTWTFHLKIMTGKNVPGNITVYARLWKSSNSDGSNATAVTDWLTLDTISSPASSTEYQVTTNVSLSEISLSNEYLFVEFALGTTSACTKSSGCTVTFRCNEGQTTTAIDTTEFSSTETGWLSGWQYRKSHEIEGSTAGAQTDYQVRIIVHKGTSEDSGEHVYCNNHCRDDFGDIRFTKDDGTTELYYWLEEYTSGDKATFWVKIPSIPASPDKVTIYIYYGNSDATTTSNGDNTFLLFDHFEGTSLDTSQWQEHNTPDYSIADSILTLNNDLDGVEDGIWALTGFLYNVAFRFKANYMSGYKYSVRVESSDESDMIHVYSNYARLQMSFNSVNDGVGAGRIDLGTGYYGAFHTYEMRWLTSKAQLYIDDSYIGEFTTQIPNEELYYHIDEWGSDQSGTLKLDWVLVRKYVDPEPTHGDWGSEQEQVTTVISVLDSASYTESIVCFLPNEEVQLTAHLEDDEGNPLSNKTIAFYSKKEGETAWLAQGTAATNDSGNASKILKLRAGTYDFKAEFAGDSSYASSSDEELDFLLYVKTVESFTSSEEVILQLLKTISDTLESTDEILRARVFSLLEEIELTSELLLQKAFKVQDLTSLTEAIKLQLSKVLLDSIQTAGEILRDKSMLLQDIVSSEEVLKPGKVLRITEDIGALEELFRSKTLAILETCTLSIETLRDKVLPVTDTSTLSDIIVRGKEFLLSDTISTSAVLYRDISFSLTDQVNLSELLAFTKQLKILGSVILSDLANKIAGIEKTVTEAVQLAETSLVDKTLQISGLAQLSGTVLVEKTSILTDNVNLVGAILKDISFSITDVVSLSEVVLRFKLILIVETLTSADIAYRGKEFALQEVASLIENILRGKQLAMLDSIQMPDSVLTFKKLLLKGDIILSDLAEVLAEFLKTVVDSLDLTEQIKTEKTLLIEDVSNILGTVLASKEFTLLEEIALSDAISLAFGILKTLSDSVSMAEELFTSKLMPIIDTLSLSEDLLINQILIVKDTVLFVESLLRDKILYLYDLVHLQIGVKVDKVLFISQSIVLAEVVLARPPHKVFYLPIKLKVRENA